MEIPTPQEGSGGGPRDVPARRPPTQSPPHAEGRAVGTLMGRVPAVFCWATSLCVRTQLQQGQDQGVAGGQPGVCGLWVLPLSLLHGATPGLPFPSPGSLGGLGAAVSPSVSPLHSALWGGPVDHTMFPGQEGDGSAPSAGPPDHLFLWGGLALQTEVSGTRAGPLVFRGGGWWLPGPPGAVSQTERVELNCGAGRSPRTPPPPRAAPWCGPAHQWAS